MKGLYHKRTKKTRKLVKNYTFGYVKKSEVLYTLIIFILVILFSVGFSWLVKNLF